MEQEVGQYATTPGMLAVSAIANFFEHFSWLNNTRSSQQTTVESDESDKISYGVLPADGSLVSFGIDSLLMCTLKHI